MALPSFAWIYIIFFSLFTHSHIFRANIGHRFNAIGIYKQHTQSTHMKTKQRMNEPKAAHFKSQTPKYWWQSESTQLSPPSMSVNLILFDYIFSRCCCCCCFSFLLHLLLLLLCECCFELVILPPLLGSKPAITSLFWASERAYAMRMSEC